MEQIPDMGTLLRLAQKPAGQKLLALLQRSGGEELSQAISKAAESLPRHPHRRSRPLPCRTRR